MKVSWPSDWTPRQVTTDDTGTWTASNAMDWDLILASWCLEPRQMKRITSTEKNAGYANKIQNEDKHLKKYKYKTHGFSYLNWAMLWSWTVHYTTPSQLTSGGAASFTRLTWCVCGNAFKTSFMYIYVSSASQRKISEVGRGCCVHQLNIFSYWETGSNWSGSRLSHSASPQYGIVCFFHSRQITCS